MTKKLSDRKLRDAVRSTVALLNKDEFDAIGDYLDGRRGRISGLGYANVARRLHVEVERLHDELADTTTMIIVIERMFVSEKRVSDYLLKKTGLDRRQVERETGWTTLEELADEFGVDLDAIRDKRATEEDSDA